MIVILEAKRECNFELNGRGYFSLVPGETIKAKFTEEGVRLLVNNVWTFPYYHRAISENLKVYNQEEN